MFSSVLNWIIRNFTFHLSFHIWNRYFMVCRTSFLFYLKKYVFLTSPVSLLFYNIRYYTKKCKKIQPTTCPNKQTSAVRGTEAEWGRGGGTNDEEIFRRGRWPFCVAHCFSVKRNRDSSISILALHSSQWCSSIDYNGDFAANNIILM